MTYYTSGSRKSVHSDIHIHALVLTSKFTTKILREDNMKTSKNGENFDIRKHYCEKIILKVGYSPYVNAC
jgi:hypothetical protein